MNKIIEEGKLACREGKGVSDNPYVIFGPCQSRMRDSWQAGYELQKAQSRVLDIEQQEAFRLRLRQLEAQPDPRLDAIMEALEAALAETGVVGPVAIHDAPMLIKHLGTAVKVRNANRHSLRNKLDAIMNEIWKVGLVPREFTAEHAPEIIGSLVALCRKRSPECDEMRGALNKIREAIKEAAPEYSHLTDDHHLLAAIRLLGEERRATFRTLISLTERNPFRAQL